MTVRGKRGKRRRTGAVRDAPAAPPQALEWSPTARAPVWVSWLLPLVVAVAALVTFWPALDAGFVNWDDDKLFLNNPNYRGLSWTHLQWMFQTTKMGHWQPLSWVSLGLDYLRCGMEPRGYHLTNMLLHAGCAVAFYFLAVRLLALSAGGSASGSVLRVAGALAALSFAVHPLRVESVVWVTERRDLLSGLFFIVTISLYLRSRTASRHRWLWYGCAVVVFILSVLSKAWGMTIPAVLIILDFYPLRRFGVSGRPWLSRETLQACLEKVPFVIVAALIAQKAIDAQGGQVDTLKPLTEHGLTPRVVQVVYGAGFYFWKTLLPTDLVPLYELIQVQRNPFELRFVVTFIGVLVALVAIIVSGRRWPAGLALVGCYLAIYSPVSGIAQSGPQLVKDSYSYLCCLSWAMLLGGRLLCVHRRWGPSRHLFCTVVVAVWVVVLAVLSWRQAGIWHDSETLWTHTVRVDDRCSLAHNNLAIMLKKAGKLQEALQHYERAVEINPDDANAHFNLGNCHKALEQYDQAIACYQQAIERQKRIKKKPVHEQAHMNLGNTYHHLKNLDGAIEHHRYLVKVNANRSAEFYNLLGRNLLKQAKELSGRERDGHLTEAQEYLQRAIRKKPEYPTALCNLAESLIEHGRCGEAVEYAERARTLRPQAKTPRRLLNRAQTECGP